jgi:hypothetical protein
MKKNVIVVIGAGSIGQAIARRVSVGKHALLADLRRENADAAATVLAAMPISTLVPLWWMYPHALRCMRWSKRPRGWAISPV